MGRQQQGKGWIRQKRPEVVEGEHLGDQFPKPQFCFKMRITSGISSPPGRRPRIPGGEHQRGAASQVTTKQRHRRKAAEQADHQLDLDEAADQIPGKVFGQPGADAHGEEVGADHRRELGDQIPEQMGRQGPAIGS